MRARQDWDRSMSPLTDALEGRVVYLDPKGYWLTIQGPRYRESFAAHEVFLGEPGVRDRSRRAPVEPEGTAASKDFCGRPSAFAPRGPYRRARRNQE